MSPSTAAPNDTSAGADRHKVSKASEVGWLFVTHYYTMMNQDPSRLYRFYTNKSAMVHATEAEETSTSVGQQQIHEKIMSIGLDDTKVVVLSVDSQSSADGGIIVQVLGELSNQGGAWRKFVQTFFLAAQTNGYYVLNDIFRYIQVDSEAAEEQADEGETAAPVAVADTAHAPAEVIEEEGTPVASSVPAAQAADASAPAATEATETSAPAPPAPAASAAPAETPKPAEPAAPKTWANLAASGANRWGNTAAEARGLSSPASAPAKAQGASPAAAPNATAPKGGKGNNAASSSAHGQVFVKHVPSGQVSAEALKKALEAQFGPTKECQLNAAKGFAFVEFVHADAARRAMAASAEGAVKIGDATVVVEKRRPHDHRGAGGRGRGGHRGGFHQHHHA
ncbi:hypothetical protein MEQU1_002253 [Malassezia equina]|uniref:G3BP-like protein n=1 Tax=Malassezia equina TaxID=1381935 RepID=A0AAF0J430_9BASI|nr:hypothetical protein MEQU1_002253 [Malassezia equina]